MFSKKAITRNAWAWIPSLYFAEGLPNIIIAAVISIMYKRMGIPNGDIIFYTSFITLPWVIKPLWGPGVDLVKTKRYWIIFMQLLLGLGLAGAALAIPTPGFFAYTLVFFWIIAFASATHDIAADGFYMLGLPVHEQAFFVGIRSTFYRLAWIFGQGVLIIFAGFMEQNTGNVHNAWMITFFILAGLFLLFFIYHNFILPYPAEDKPVLEKHPNEIFWKEFFRTFVLFFKKKNIGVVVAFILLYRFGETQLGKVAPLFLLDPVNKGGIGLSTIDYGLVYGTIGIISLVLGGILGGVLTARNGLKYWLLPMVCAINIPDVVYVYLSYTQSANIYIVSLMVAIEQFGYGLGFAAYMLVLIYICEGDYKASHYAIATGLMALGVFLTGLISGWLQPMLGYKLFFIWVLIATIPGFILVKFLDIDPGFGKKKNEE